MRYMTGMNGMIDYREAWLNAERRIKVGPEDPANTALWAALERR